MTTTETEIKYKDDRPSRTWMWVTGVVVLVAAAVLAFVLLRPSHPTYSDQKSNVNGYATGLLLARQPGNLMLFSRGLASVSQICGVAFQDRNLSNTYNQTVWVNACTAGFSKAVS